MGAQDQRPSFYEGQFLAADDLAAIIEYLRGADARHALGAHTWGIAVGLYLLERRAPGPTDRREIILTPGVAWDGYGRAIVVTRPTRLPEELCDGIVFDASVDSGAAPTGRAVRVWLNYSEIAARPPAAGFESCTDEDQNARVFETFDVVVGAVPEGPGRQGNVVIGTETLQAEEALRRFDSDAQPLYDASVAHQTFPSRKKPPPWLVPVGLVRWVAREDSLGYFAASDGVPEYRIKDCTRAFRRYIGAVVEHLVAADGAIVLRRRDQDPRERHKLAWLLNCGRSAEELLSDLAWVEGNLRVVGDAKLARGRLLMRDADGDDEGAPIYLARVGDDPEIDTKRCCENLDAAAGTSTADDKAKQPREFRAVIGKKGQNKHRFIVGPEVAGARAEDPTTLAPRFVVMSGTGGDKDGDAEGRTGVNTRDPHAALEVVGDWNGKDGAIRVAGKRPAIRFEGGPDVGNERWLMQTVSSPQGAMRLARWDPGANDWQGIVHVTPGHKVGIGVELHAPRSPLSVRAQPPETGTDAEKATWDELVSFEDRGGGKKWHLNCRIEGGGKHLNFAETGVADGRLYLKAGGNVGIATMDPQRTLHVAGDAAIDGNTGIGTTNPQRKLHVQGERIRLEKDGKRLELRADGGAVDVQSDTHTLYIHSLGPAGQNHLALNPHSQNGNVGVGTANPQQKLHVAGDFLRVDGRGAEQAYIGGDGSANIYGQDVQIGSMKSGLTEVHFWNTADSDWMWLTSQGMDTVSDAKHKSDVATLSGALDKVTQMRGVTFNWKQPTVGAARARGGVGVIAQEVAQVLPQAVGNARGDMTVSYNALVALLIEAAKELKAEVDGLRAEVRKLSPEVPKK